MRRTLKGLGKSLQGITVNDVRQASLVFFGVSSLTFVIGGVVYVSGNRGAGLSITLAIPFVVASLLIYFVGTFFMADAFHWLGKKFVELSEWYPERWYRPKFYYYFKVNSNNELILYAESDSKNKEAHLTLDFSRLKPIGIENVNRDFPNIKNKRLFNGDIKANQKVPIVVSGKDVNGKYVLTFPNELYAIPLYPGRYKYPIFEYGRYKDVGFKSRTRTLEFVYNKKGEFEV